ncbi:hypothetical protein JCM3765_004534 [Sporobolomyces pararoseus]
MISSTSSNTVLPQAGAAQITQPQPVVTRQMSTVSQPGLASSMVINSQQETIETGRESSSEEAMRLRGGGCCTGFLRGSMLLRFGGLYWGLLNQLEQEGNI